MQPKIHSLTYSQPVVLLGGGDCDLALLRQITARRWPLVAADGGANRLFNTDIPLAAIVGDLDSLRKREEWESVCQVLHVLEQDTTDFEKCLYHCRAPLFVAFGFTGKRFDHTLAALHALHRYVDSKTVVLVTDTDVITVVRGAIAFEMPPGTRFSVYPMERVSFSSSEGLRYPLNDLVMQQGRLIGCSNSISNTPIGIAPSDRGAYAIIVPLSEFDSMVAALMARG